MRNHTWIWSHAHTLHTDTRTDTHTSPTNDNTPGPRKQKHLSLALFKQANSCTKLQLKERWWERWLGVSFGLKRTWFLYQGSWWRTKLTLVCQVIFFFLFRATPVACGSSQARRQIGAAAASLHHSHSHSNDRSEQYLQPTRQLAKTLEQPTEQKKKPLSKATEQSQGLNLHLHGH